MVMRSLLRKPGNRKLPAAFFVAGKWKMENQSSNATELKSSSRSSKLGPLAEINFTCISDVKFKECLMKML